MIPIEKIGVMEIVQLASLIMLFLKLNSNFSLIILIKVKAKNPYYHGNMDGN
jgi:hypothetical protein